MKKYLLLLLTTITFGQTYQNPTYGTITTKTNTESATATKINVQETSGLINWLQPVNIPISIIPTNYVPTAPTLGGHLSGIDTKLGNLTNTTAGVTTRVWFTADQTTITAGTFDLTNPLNKGTVASHQQTVANDDGQKKYFTTDLIGQPFATVTTFPIGLYAGNLSVSTTPTNANQKFTVELYRCNNAGTPIASGVTGAPVGSLGVTVIMILDSGEVTLANASVTNLPVSTILGSAFNIAVGERIRYHVSAEKVGTAGGVINESVYYGSSYNSYIDVPVIYNSSSIKDVSTITNGTGTVTDALNTLNLSNMQKAYNNSIVPQIATSTSLGAVTVRRGSSADIDKVLDIQNGVGGSVTSIDGEGSVRAKRFSLDANSIGNSNNRLSGAMDSDFYNIYGEVAVANKGKLVFEVGDEAAPIGTNGQSFEFRYTDASSVVSKIPLTIDYNDITALANVTATSFIKSGATSTDALLAGGGTLANPVSGTGVNGQVSYWNGTNTQSGGSNLYWNNANNLLGVGTSAPTNYGPGNSTVSIFSSTGSGFLDIYNAGSRKGLLYSDATALNISTASSAELSLQYNSIESIRINQSSHVLINKSTDSADGVLQVNGTVSGSPATLSTQFVTKAQLDAAKPYKVYKATVFYTSGSYTANVLENSVGSVVIAGSINNSFTATLSGAFTSGKTFIDATMGRDEGWSIINAKIDSTSQITFDTDKDFQTTGFAFIEIQVYP